MYEELLHTALEAARKSADILLEQRDSLSVSDADEKGARDFVTEVDRTSEAAIIKHILHEYPDHSILAEESGYHQSAAADSDCRWIIDPLDGTTNYIHGYPQFAVSVAAQVKGQIVAGVVIDVDRNEEFTAEKGGGAKLNGASISVSPVKNLDKALILTGFPFKANKHMEDFITVFRDLLPRSSGIRRAGSAALDLAHIAAGRADGFWEFGLSAWDIAAGELLVTEAGGIVTDVEGGNRHLETGHTLCGNPAIYEELKNTLQAHFEPGYFIISES